MAAVSARADILERILQRKHEEVAARRTSLRPADVVARAHDAGAVRPFAASLRSAIAQGRRRIAARKASAAWGRGARPAATGPKA